MCAALQGVKDLRDGIIRTPLTPRTTLLDDPLRALRAIRFASKLRFKIDDDLSACLGSTEVHVCASSQALLAWVPVVLFSFSRHLCGALGQNALASKVSRERMGTELNGALLSA